MRIQLLTFPGCPNAGPAREALRAALAALGLPLRFEEVNVTAAGTPEALRGWPSPTVLLDGEDALGQPPGAATGCRVGAPSEAALRAALEKHLPARRGFWQALAVIPAALLAVLPHLTCPACWPAYAALLSALGLGVLARARFLTPLLVAALAVNAAAIAWSMRRHWQPGPLALTLLGSAAVAAGRLVWDVPPLLWAGTVLLVGAALWNLRLRRPAVLGAA